MTPHQDFIIRVQAELQLMRDVGRPTSRWLYLQQGDFYLRLTKHYFHGMKTTVDLASISIHPPYQSQGYFKALLQAAEEFAASHHIEAVYVESVLNPIVDRYLRKVGYIDLPFDYSTMCKPIERA